MSDPNTQVVDRKRVQDPTKSLADGEYRVQVVDLTGKEPAKKLESRKTISFEYLSPSDHRKYDGTITFRRLPIHMATACEVEKARRTYGLPPLSDASMYLHMQVDLKHQVEAGPTWLTSLESPKDGEEVFDTDLVTLLWNELEMFNATFRVTVQEINGGASPNSGAQPS